MATNANAIAALLGHGTETAARLLDKQEFTADQLKNMKPQPLQEALILHGKMLAGAAMRAVERVHPGSIAHTSGGGGGGGKGPQKRKADDGSSGSSQPAAAKAKVEESESFIGVVIDRSGSMAPMHKSVVNGYNELRAEHLSKPGKAFWFATQFDGQVDVLHRGAQLKDVPEATMFDFEPRGSTALYDAVAHTILKMKKFIAAQKKTTNRFVVLTIFTDGQDNSSAPATKATVADEIKRLQEEEDWVVMFVGANQDAVKAGATLNVPANMSLTFSATAEKCEAAFRAVSATQRELRRHVTEGECSAGGAGGKEAAAAKETLTDPVPPPPLLGFTELMRAQTQEF